MERAKCSWSALPLTIIISAALLSGCDGGASAVAKDPPQTAAIDHRQDPVPLLDGQPVWAASRKHSAAENLKFQYTKNGQAVGANSQDNYVRKARDFLSKPPRSALTLDRPNGDRLIYDPKTNLFGVVTAEGAPRTLFKPKDGLAYWQAQTERSRPVTAPGSDRRAVAASPS